MAVGSSTSLTRAIAILNVLGSAEGTTGEGLGVVQIARLVGREKSQVSRTLRVLAESGLVVRDPESLRYRLGWRLFALAAGVANQHLLTLAPHALRHLVGYVGERAHLSVLEGNEVLTLLSERPTRAMKAGGWVGRAAPLYCTSSGRALLFNHTDSEVRTLLSGADFAAAGPNAPVDIDDLLARLHADRERGWVQSSGEFEPGMVAVAASVRDFRGRTAAALNISAPEFRLGHGLVAAGRVVAAAADRLTRALTEAGTTTTTTSPRRIS
ncbi:MAG: IclR family transcriptional regulator [Nocardiopsaceae bacterium]|nr:IclR family transcriptional regulator [Nocardiopsaceae bacterium]